MTLDNSDRQSRELNTTFLDLINQDLRYLSASEEIIQTIRTRVEDFLYHNEEMFSARDAFFWQLNHALRSLIDPMETQAEATRVLGEYLQANRVTYFKVIGDDYVVERDYVDGVTHLFGRYPVSSFGQTLLSTFQTGAVTFSHDVQADADLSPAEKKAFADIQIGAYISVPLVKNGQFVAGLAVHSLEPRQWTTSEITIVEKTAERTWSAVEHARAETALRESEVKYRSLFESIDNGFCLLEVLFDSDETPYDYRFLEVNGAFEAQSGLSDAVGKTILELVPNLEPQWIEHYGQVAKSGNAIRFEADVSSMNRFFDIYAYPSNASGENVVAVLFTDISDRKRAEATIAAELRNTQLLRELATRLVTEGDIQTLYQEVISAAIALTHADGGTVQILDDASQELVLIATQGFSRTMTDYFYRVDASSNTSCGMALRSGDRTFIDFDVPASEDPDGSLQMHVEAGYLSAQSTPLISRSGRAIGMVSTHWHDHRRLSDRELRFLDLLARQASDLIEQRQFEQALRQSESRFRFIVESAKDYAIFTLDLNGIVTSWNVGAERLLGYSEAEIIGREGRIIFTPEDQEQGKAEREMELAQTQGQVENERWHMRQDGSRFWASGLVMPLQDKAGTMQGLVKILQDKTTERQNTAEREQLLQQEQAARVEADRANRIKDQFLAVLSHELRTPLNPILGWTRLLQTGKLDATRQSEALKRIERNAKLQTQLIEDLLDISRIMRGKLSLTVADLSLTTVITSAVETVRLAADAKQIQILLDLPTEIAPVSGDEARLQQVVWNLLANAVKFTPKGGRVRVELRQIDRLAQIRVIDTGKGIDPEFLPYVFEYFRQEDSTSTRKFGGLGLGLAIVRQIVEMHGGTVGVESLGEDRGSTFIVELPVIVQAVPNQAEPKTAQVENWEESLNNLQILLVDDEEDTLEYQAFILSESGAKVVAVASSSQALQELDRFIPDVLVSDIGMAEMDGYMLIQYIRSRPADRGGTIPAIAVTAYAQDFDRQKAFRSGFQAHITKPVEPEVLIQVISSLLASTSS